MADDASDAPGSSDAVAAPAHLGADGALLPAKLPHAELSARVLAAIRDRGTNQTQLCAALSLAPANFSLWKNDKHFRVKELYSAALERWLENPQLELDDPGLTGTVPHQVPPRNTALGVRQFRREQRTVGAEVIGRRCGVARRRCGLARRGIVGHGSRALPRSAARGSLASEENSGPRRRSRRARTAPAAAPLAPPPPPPRRRRRRPRLRGTRNFLAAHNKRRNHARGG